MKIAFYSICFFILNFSETRSYIRELKPNIGASEIPSMFSNAIENSILATTTKVSVCRDFRHRSELASGGGIYSFTQDMLESSFAFCFFVRPAGRLAPGILCCHPYLILDIFSSRRNIALSSAFSRGFFSSRTVLEKTFPIRICTF